MKLTKMYLLLSTIIGWLIVSSCGTGKKNSNQPEIPILAWYSIPGGEFATEERYQELRDAGFTLTFPHINNYEDAVTALDLSAKVGMKCIFMCPELEKEPEETAKKVMNHPGLGGYFLRDEPGNDALDALGEWARRIQSVDNEHPCYLNLLPVHAYAHDWYPEHLELFCQKVPLPQISYDHYPIKDGGQGIFLEPRFYENLEMVSAKAKEVNKPFWAFALSTAHNSYPIPTIGHLRLQQYSNLAYGAQCLQYFTYWNPGTETWNFHQAPITQDGQRSPLYELVREFNQELQRRAEVFVGCTVESVYHVGDNLPPHTKPLPALPEHFLELDTHGKGALVSTISNNGKCYVLVQNTSPTESLQLNMRFDNQVMMIRRDNSQVQANKYGPLFILPEGDVVIFQIQEATKPEAKMKALIVSGQNNHNWPISHRALKLILEGSGLFTADVALTAAQGGDMSTFTPWFDKHDVVVLDYNGDRWPAQTDSAFLKYVQNGGGVLIYHAADNAFADWKEFNEIIALGGWEGRTEKAGPYYYLVNGKPTLDHSPGPGGSHGQQFEFPMLCQKEDHPITRGLPNGWMHARDEMYDRMRGPANIKDLLYSGQTDANKGGSGREEPLVFTVDYGKARIFHLMLGHCGPSLEDNPAMQCAGFQTLLLRGAEWCATGDVKQPVPADFPTAERTSYRRNYTVQ